MDATELREFIRQHFTRTAFRLETLQQYDPTAPDYRRYLDGEPGPNKQAWVDRLRSERDRGLYRHRVRIVTHPVTEYTRYECEWGYAPNVAAGEDVRIYDIGSGVWRGVEHDVALGDWWLVTDRDGEMHGVLMKYADDGRFLSAEEVTSSWQLKVLAQTRDEMWADAEPFTEWWASHQELHRDQRRAA